MVKIENILFPTDFSESSVHALEYALFFSRKFNAKMYILHVIHETMDITGFYVPHISVEKLREEIAVSGRKMMEEFCRKHLSSSDNFESITVTGIPYKEILRIASEKKADMIIMGTLGRSGINKAVFGSVAEEVVKRAECPVLTTRQRKPA